MPPKRKKPRPGPAKKHYDVEMVRDFLQHLLWELRVSHWEQVRPGTDENLMAKLEPFVRRYNTAGLLVATRLLPGDATPEKYEQAKAMLKARIKATRDEQLSHLEALQQLFEEALQCATIRGFAAREYLVKDVLEGEK